MSTELTHKLIVENRRARHDYLILEKLEVGIVLMGTEIKSLRMGRVSIVESHAAEKAGDMYLFNLNIQDYPLAKNFGHDPKRAKRLLLRKREIRRLVGSVTRKGMTLVPLSLYFNERGRVKLSLGLAKGKNKGDKREAEKEKDWIRQKERLLKDY